MSGIPQDTVAVLQGRSMAWPWRNYFTKVDNQLQSKADWTPTAALADGAVSFTVVAVSGAGINDVALATHDQIGANNVLLTAFVQGPDEVRVVLMNKTGAPLSVAAGSVYVVVLRRQP